MLLKPEARFATLPDFPWKPHYEQLAELRAACINEGPRDAPVVLLMHGEPALSFLYCKMIPPLLQAGYRVVAPDLIGFGRSDKPARKADYSYLNHVFRMHAWLEADAGHALALAVLSPGHAADGLAAVSQFVDVVQRLPPGQLGGLRLRPARTWLTRRRHSSSAQRQGSMSLPAASLLMMVRAC